MVLSKRLLAVANEIDKNDYVIDVGCDHCYLGIYLVQNNLCKKIIATEIAINPYNIAKKNIIKSNFQSKITLYLTDGLHNIKEKFNTIVISGMGAHTIKTIISEYTKLSDISKIIIQSNNDWPLIREFLINKGFYIEKEIYTSEANKDYNTIVFLKGKRNYLPEEILFGLYDSKNISFYKNQLIKFEKIFKQIPKTNLVLKKDILNKINELKRRIN